MQHKIQIFRNFLERACIYNLVQWLLGEDNVKNRYVSEFLRPEPNAIVLDIGCGPGTMIKYLPHSVKYYGFDHNRNYIEHAKECFPGRGVFLCKDVNDEELLRDLPAVDLIIAMGILHHLDDGECIKLFNFASKIMKKNARMITFDGCYVENQSKIATYLLKKDRGKYVRTLFEYERLAASCFPKVKSTVSHDLLRVPYTHLIMECS